jgi:glycerol transport system permease protein
MTVVNYSVQDIISPERRVFVGTEWFVAGACATRTCTPRCCGSWLFSLAVLGDGDAAGHPAGAGHARNRLARLGDAGAGRAVAADPLERGGHASGRSFGRTDIGLLGAALSGMGFDYNYTGNCHARLAHGAGDGRLALDAAGGAAVLCRAAGDPGRLSTRRPASTAPSRLAVFRYVQLPKLRGVLMIAVLLRFMDSFMIYTEPFVLTGGGPGNATTFLSQYLTQKAVGQFDLGPGGRVLADLLPDHPAVLLRPLQLDAARRHGRTARKRGHE